MNIHTDKTQDNKTRAVANSLPKQQVSAEAGSQQEEQSPDSGGGLLHSMANTSPQVQQLKVIQSMANEGRALKQLKSVRPDFKISSAPAQLAENTNERAPATKFTPGANTTGMPDNLKSGIENLSGFSMNDVKVHYNSDKPAQLQAHAYAQGSEIHLASGQEKHLPHEAWHVVQQKQNRVRPTVQLKGVMAINDDAGLEKEADIMGAKALDVSSRLPSPEESAISGQLMGHSLNTAPLATSQMQVRQFVSGCSSPPSLDNVITKGTKSAPETIANQIGEESEAFADLRGRADNEVSRVHGKKKVNYKEKPKTGAGTGPAYFKDGETFFDKGASMQSTVLNVIFETANAAQAGLFKKLEDDYLEDQETFFRSELGVYVDDPGELGGLAEDYRDAPSKRSLIQEYYEWKSLLIARKSLLEIAPKFTQGGDVAQATWAASFEELLNCKNFEEYYKLQGKVHRGAVEATLRPKEKGDEKGQINMDFFGK